MEGKVKLYFDYEFPNWNEYIRAERANKYKAAAMKKKEKTYVCFVVKEKYEGEYPATLIVRPHFQNKRRDLDNYRIKGLVDGLVAAGVIVNDNLKYIDKIILEAVFENTKGVEVELQPSKEAE